MNDKADYIIHDVTHYVPHMTQSIHIQNCLKGAWWANNMYLRHNLYTKVSLFNFIHITFRDVITGQFNQLHQLLGQLVISIAYV